MSDTKCDVLVFERFRRGHREAYIGYFSNIIKNSCPLYGLSLYNVWKLIKADKVIFSTADDYFIYYVLLSFIRSLLRKTSLGILIRAEICLDRNDWRRILKKNLLMAQLRLGFGRSISIMPFFVEPRLQEFVSGWIYDPAFFSRNEASGISTTDLEKSFLEKVRREKMHGRLLVLFIGSLSKERGFSEYMQLAVAESAVNSDFAFVACGTKTAATDEDEARSFNEAGGLLLSERVTEETFNDLLRMADCIWCVFGEEYDQFSGIFCNAMRNGTATLVRKNSRLHKFADSFSGAGHQAVNCLLERLSADERILEYNPEFYINRMRSKNDSVLGDI